MKNRLLSLAGALALIAVLGKFYAAPAIAQVVRAAVVKNIDEKGRIPYQVSGSCLAPVAGISCSVPFPAVPANRRFVIEYVNTEFTRTAGFDPTAALSFIGTDNLSHRFELPTFFRSGSTYGLSTPVLIYLEAGQTISLEIFGTVPQAHLVGYLVDLTQ